ncbi:hypothetical protein KP509_27G013900 [Ceratopteris richardii]|uniref:Protein kinase domain-containing protein n=1 Tax=Ceratopteris richardii TaxID=49495 RepID=A0A8T2RGG4_CERRI|nr:hypothetical protein KP509_27G013900 [Ceratopteris richardii]
MRTEISIFERLQGHPNVVEFHGYFEDDEHIHLLLEMCEGGDLCEHLQQKGRLSEREAAQAIAAIIKAVMFCHERGVMHRDLKPENILLPYKNCSYMDLKLADFGTAADFSHGKIFDEMEGTPLYIAPEVLTRSYDEKVDVWSLGVLLYIMLCGYPPFNGESVDEIFQSIKRGRPNLTDYPWSSISLEAKDLVKNMLQKNPYRRFKLRDLSAHPWMQEYVFAGDELKTDMQAQALNSLVVGG